MLKNENVSIDAFKKYIDPKFSYIVEDQKFFERLRTQAVYENQESIQEYFINEVRLNESICLPETLNYNKINISNEAKDKIRTWKPTTIDELKNIPGMTPAAVISLINHIKNHHAEKISR